LMLYFISLHKTTLIKTFLFFIALSAVSNVLFADDKKFESAYQNWKDTKNKDGYIAHLEEIVEHNNTLRLDEGKNCYSKGVHSSELILVYNIQGLIVSAIPKSDDIKTLCFSKLYLGKVFPKPPYAPFYEHVIFK